MIDRKLDLRWVAESRADVMTREMMEKMIAAGCIGLQFRVESGSQKTLDAIKKKITREQVLRAVQISHDLEMDTACSFIIGLPGETVDTIQETVEFAMMLQSQYEVQALFSIATPLPGTYMYNHARELEMEIHSDNWDDYNFFNPIFSTPNLSVQKARSIHFETTLKLMSCLPEKVRNRKRAEGREVLSLVADPQWSHA